MSINYEEDVEHELAPDSEGAQNISALVSKQLDLEAQVADLEARLKAKKQELATIAERSLPEAMVAAGVAAWKTTSGSVVELREELVASISADRMPKVVAWCRKQKDAAGLVKNEVNVTLGKNSDNQAKALVASLKDMGLDFTRKESVNTTSLKAVLRKRLKDGGEVDLGLFGATMLRKAVINP